jgi:broad specificity phosphatase PhoE
MKCYIVRHGETEGNVAHIHQKGETPLNERGIQQAKALATRFSTVPIDRILTSPLLRAQQTAQIIAKVRALPIQVSDYLSERRYPSEFIDKAPGDIAIQKIMEQIEAHYTQKEWHYSDEENFNDFDKRGKKALGYLESFSADRNVVVVTHGFMVSMLLLQMMTNKNVGPLDYRQFAHFAVTTTTGITLCEYAPLRGWKLITYNDHAHLLE